MSLGLILIIILVIVLLGVAASAATATAMVTVGSVSSVSSCLIIRRIANYRPALICAVSLRSSTRFIDRTSVSFKGPMSEMGSGRLDAFKSAA
jgi:hypothetical protein